VYSPHFINNKVVKTTHYIFITIYIASGSVGTEDNMKKRISIDGSTIFVLFIMATGAFFCYISIVDFNNFSYKVKTFPMFTSIVLILLCAIELLSGYFKCKSMENEGDVSNVSQERKKEGLNIFYGFCWMLSIPLAIMIFGFYVTLPLFTLIFLRANKVGWIPSIVLAVGVLLVVYFGFGVALRLRFFPGLLFGGKL